MIAYLQNQQSITYHSKLVIAYCNFASLSRYFNHQQQADTVSQSRSLQESHRIYTIALTR